MEVSAVLEVGVTVCVAVVDNVDSVEKVVVCGGDVEGFAVSTTEKVDGKDVERSVGLEATRCGGVVAAAGDEWMRGVGAVAALTVVAVVVGASVVGGACVAGTSETINVRFV